MPVEKPEEVNKLLLSQSIKSLLNELYVYYTRTAFYDLQRYLINDFFDQRKIVNNLIAEQRSDLIKPDENTERKVLMLKENIEKIQKCF